MALRWEGDYVYGVYQTFVRTGVSASGKTQRWEVRGTRDKLGTIAWFGRWRQYVFFPEPDTAFNDNCLKETTEFLGSLMNERAARKRQVLLA